MIDRDRRGVCQGSSSRSLFRFTHLLLFYLATRPVADAGMPAACVSGSNEPFWEMKKPWILLVPGVRTYRNRLSLLIAASSGMLREPVLAVTPSPFSNLKVPSKPTL